MRSVSDKKPPGDIERLLFPVYPSPEEMNNIGDSPYPYQPATPQLGMDDILRYLVSERGGDPELWKNLAYYIGFHESGPHQRMSPTARQISDGGVEGPARGTYQFEKDSFDTAKQRYRNLFSAMRDMGYKGDMDQDILEANNADELPLDKQTALLYANLIQGPAKLADYVSGDMSATDLWLKGHKLKEAEGNRERFEESMRAADEQRETYYPFVGNNLRSVDTESKPILPAENRDGGRVAGNKSGGGAESDDDTSITDGRGRVIKYKNGGRPGGFLSSNARDGWPKAHKSYYPFSGRDVTVEDGVTTVENRQGYDSGMKEMLELIRMGSGGSRRQISLPTGREYKDTDLMRTTTRYAGDDFIDQKSARYKLHKDDKAKTFDQYKGVKTPKGSKSVEIQGEDLNWLQRNFPRLFLERYKTKSKYNDEGELVKKVKVSRAGGREVKKYPTSAELDAIIEQDIKAAQAQDNTNASGGRVVKYNNGGKGPDDPPNIPSTQELMDALRYYKYMFSNQRVRDAVGENVGTYQLLDKPMVDEYGNRIWDPKTGRDKWSTKDVFDNILKDDLKEMYPNRKLDTPEDLADAYMDMRTDILQAGVKYTDPEDDPASYGYVRMFDRRYRPGHEYRPMVMGLGPAQSRGIMEFEIDRDREGLGRIDTVTHELSHAQESGADIPEEMLQYMRDRQIDDDTYYADLEKNREGETEDWQHDVDEFFRNYYTEPTEVLARLNAGRRLIYEAEGGNLLKTPSMLQVEGGPFSKDLTYEDLNKYYQEIPEFKDIMDELTPHYTSEGIIDMFNNVYKLGGRVRSKMRVVKKR